MLVIIRTRAPPRMIRLTSAVPDRGLPEKHACNIDDLMAVHFYDHTVPYTVWRCSGTNRGQ